MPDGPRYDDDFYAWTQYQAEVLRSMPCDDNRFDRENVAEEIEDLGKSERNAVRSEIRRIIEHLLKLAHSPAKPIRASTGWPRSSARAPNWTNSLSATLRRDRRRSRSPRLYAQCTQASRAADCVDMASPAPPMHCRRPALIRSIRYCRRGLVSRTAARRTAMTRDFVGYGAEPPHARWPGDARIAVNFVINFEEGSELSYPAGDGVSETGLIESPAPTPANRPRPRAPRACSNTAPASAGGGSIASSPASAAGDDVRLRPGARGEPARRRGDRRQRLGHLRPRLSLDQASRAGRKPRNATRSPPPSS